jgi:hypothetical protein
VDIEMKILSKKRIVIFHVRVINLATVSGAVNRFYRILNNISSSNYGLGFQPLAKETFHPTTMAIFWIPISTEILIENISLR